MSNRFYIDDDTSSASSNDLDLPYPKPLTRAAFLTPDFDPTEFLSSLNNRFQTLEDLRAELRQRSQDLNKELLDLVNSNYEDFLSLGRDLKGGDKKIEEVKLSVLGFRREIEGVRDKVRARRIEVEKLVLQKERVRREIVFTKSLIEVDRRIGDLERMLMIFSNGQHVTNGIIDSDGDSEDELDEELGIAKLRRHAEQYVYISRSVDGLGPEHPFLLERDTRVQKMKQTILLDLNGALKKSIQIGSASEDALQLLKFYELLDESQEAIKIVKEAKKRRK